MNDEAPTDPGRDALRQLMAAYFHQDWMDEYGASWHAAVDDFARREPDQVGPATAQIRDLLSHGMSDAELATALDDLGNYRHAGDEPDAYVSWLGAVRARLLASHLGGG